MPDPGPPPDTGQNPFLPAGTLPVVFERFDGMDTSATRSGIADEKCYWMDGFMPLGNRNARTVPGIGDLLYTSDIQNGISFFRCGNLGSVPIMIVAISDGRLLQVNVNTGAVTTIATAGTIQNPSRSSVGISQWGNKYILIAADQENGYFIWDGTSFFKPGSLAPDVTVDAGGSGYTAAPTVSISGGSGTGASIVAVVTSGAVTSASVVAPGSGYSVGNTVTLSLSGGGGSGASLSAIIMPYGIRGTALETYTSRVWVQNGENVTFTAPGSVTDFSTSNGGGTFASTDSFLRVKFTQLIQTNGFLYLIADSSINYISGVNTSGSPPTTTFTNQNADPEIGTPYGASADVFSRNIVFANAYGIHVSYGGAVTKVSRELDGFYASVPDFAGQIISSAKAVIFGRKVWMCLVPIIDLVTGQQVNKLLIWDGRVWFVSSQDIPLTFISFLEINSVLTAYGTNGTQIYPLFQRPSTAFTKRIQSKLWDRPTYALTKTFNRLFGLAFYNEFESPELRIKIDNENSSFPAAGNFQPNEYAWTDAAGDPYIWTDSGGGEYMWYSSGSGVVVFDASEIAQNGVMVGMTVETEAADVTLVSLTVMGENFGYRG